MIVVCISCFLFNIGRGVVTAAKPGIHVVITDSSDKVSIYKTLT